jgi:hypothetical protein
MNSTFLFIGVNKKDNDIRTCHIDKRLKGLITMVINQKDNSLKIVYLYLVYRNNSKQQWLPSLQSDS